MDMDNDNDISSCDDEVEDYKALFDDAKNQRAQEQAQWQEVYDYFYARPIDINTGSPKSNKKEKADSTGILLLNQLTNHLSGSLTNQMSRWFRLGVLDDGINKNKRVRDWLESCSDIIIQHINQSNFYSEVKKAYRELGATGNVGFYVGEGKKSSDDLFNFSARGIYEYVILEDHFGKVKTIIRSPMKTGREIVSEWGATLPDNIMKQCTMEPAKRYKLLHVIEPRKIYDDGKKDKKNKPIKSLWVFYETNQVIEEGGFDEMPFAVGRLNQDSSSEYGLGFAVQGLREIKTLNAVRADTMKAKSLAVRPPLLVPDGSLMSKGEINPGQNILYRPMPGRQGPAPLLTGGQPQYGDQEAERSLGVLKELFFNDALQVVDTKYETREGVMQRGETQTRLLASTMAELQNDFFEVIVMRCFFIAARRGLLPTMPPELIGKKFSPIWLSPLALRSKEATLDPMLRSIQQVSMVSQAFAQPIEGMDVVNKDNVIRRIWDANGAPSDCIYDANEVKAKRQAKADEMNAQIEMQQAMQGMNQMADAESKTANTNGAVGETMRALGKAMKNG